MRESALSWFDYRSRGFEAAPKRGLRIDQILPDRASDEAAQRTPGWTTRCAPWTALRSLPHLG